MTHLCQKSHAGWGMSPAGLVATAIMHVANTMEVSGTMTPHRSLRTTARKDGAPLGDDARETRFRVRHVREPEGFPEVLTLIRYNNCLHEAVRVQRNLETTLRNMCYRSI